MASIQHFSIFELLNVNIYLTVKYSEYYGKRRPEVRRTVIHSAVQCYAVQCHTDLIYFESLFISLLQINLLHLVINGQFSFNTPTSVYLFFNFLQFLITSLTFIFFHHFSAIFNLPIWRCFPSILFSFLFFLFPSCFRSIILYCYFLHLLQRIFLYLFISFTKVFFLIFTTFFT